MAKEIVKKEKPVGTVTHYYGNIKVAIVKCKALITLGDMVQCKGNTTDFTMRVASLQYDHQPIKKTKKGQEVGLKVNKRVREGDEVFVV